VPDLDPAAHENGFALNLDVDLAQFGLIVPCGISAHPVTSLRELAGQTPGVRQVAMNLDRHLAWALDQPVAAVTDLSQLPTSELFREIASAAPAALKSDATELVP
jgi:lipoate-protein ligase B